MVFNGDRHPNNINYIILFYILSFSSLFLGSGFYNPNHLEIQKELILKFLAPKIQNILIGNFQTS